MNKRVQQVATGNHVNEILSGGANDNHREDNGAPSTSSGSSVITELATTLCDTLKQSASEEATSSRVFERNVTPRQPQPYS